MAVSRLKEAVLRAMPECKPEFFDRNIANPPDDIRYAKVPGKAAYYHTDWSSDPVEKIRRFVLDKSADILRRAHQPRPRDIAELASQVVAENPKLEGLFNPSSYADRTSVFAPENLPEFGIGREQYDAICGNVEELFDNLAADPPKDIGYVEFGDGEAGEEEEEYLDLLHNPNYEIVYEKHSWEHVKDFFDEFDELEDGAEYALLFQVTEDKERYNTAFGNTILGILLARNPNKRRSLTCSMGETADGANHFWLLKKKA